MLYVTSLTIPAQTPVASPASTTLVVTAGQITEVEILFPPGCKGLVGVRVKDFEHVIFPTNPDEWVISDDDTVDWNEDYLLAGAPWTLTLEGYNDDDTFSHTIYFRFAMMGLEKVSLLGKLFDWVKGW
jgi:hypothetical protein